MVTLGFSSPTQAEQHSLSNSAKLILLTLSGIYKCKYEDDNYNEKANIWMETIQPDFDSH